MSSSVEVEAGPLREKPAVRAEPRLRRAAAPATRGDRVAQAIALLVLFVTPALLCLHTACVNDPDIWWHLRTGEWVMAHHAVPRVDPYGPPGAGRPWAAYSWLFEVVLYGLETRLGLVGVVAYSTGMIFAITLALYHLIRRLQADNSVILLLGFAASLSLGRLYTPRPWLFTILLFTLELDILMQVRRTGRTRELAWLPVIFAVWANVHIQFVDGLAVLGLAVGEAVYARVSQGRKSNTRVAWLGGALLVSVLATLVNPYGWGIYKVAYELASQPGVLDKISELQAIPFREMPDFFLLGLALGAAWVMGRMRRLPVFETGLLGLAAVLSFRSLRDMWVMAIAAAAILAAGVTVEGTQEDQELPRFTVPGLAMVGLAIVWVGFRVMGMGNAGLAVSLAKDTPVAAVDFVKSKGYGGPVYNDYGWGGYLIWALRMPVTIDGRAALHGDERINRSVATWSGQPEWRDDPELAGAGVVIANRELPLTQLLRGDSRFALAYEDGVAAVFVPAGRR